MKFINTYMSRIGKMPIEIKQGVEVNVTPSEVSVKGPKGELKMDYQPCIKVEKKDQQIEVSIADDSNKQAGSLWGVTRTLINNMVIGVTDGFEKKLEINGVGVGGRGRFAPVDTPGRHTYNTRFDLC